MNYSAQFLSLVMVLVLTSPTSFAKTKKSTNAEPAEVETSAPSEMIVAACLREVKNKLEIIENKSDEARFTEVILNSQPAEIKETKIPDMAPEGGRKKRRKAKTAPQPKPDQKGFEIYLAGSAKDSKKVWKVKGKCLVTSKKIVFSTYELE